MLNFFACSVSPNLTFTCPAGQLLGFAPVENFKQALIQSWPANTFKSPASGIDPSAQRQTLLDALSKLKLPLVEATSNPASHATQSDPDRPGQDSGLHSPFEPSPLVQHANPFISGEQKGFAFELSAPVPTRKAANNKAAAQLTNDGRKWRYPFVMFCCSMTIPPPKTDFNSSS